MNQSLKSKLRWLGAGWYWPLVLLVLPTCGLATEPLPDDGFDRGDLPHTSAVMCDIPDVQQPEWECVPPGEDPMGVRIEDAAIALTTTQQSIFKLDYSDLAACPGDQPKRLKVVNVFPDGTAVCLNCGQQLGPSKKFADAKAVCVSQCKDLFTHETETPPPGGVDAFCDANANLSTNFPLHSCFENACTTGGNADPNFPDPRRDAEPVEWTDFNGGVSANGNILTRDAAASGVGLAGFNAGAASTKAIFTKSGWVEFATPDANLDAILGLTFAPGYPAEVDGDPSATDIGFGILLRADGNVYVIESGNVITTGPGPNGSFVPYVAGDHFRIHVTDNLDGGTSTISYTRVDGLCFPASPCSETPLYTSKKTSKYPLRVDASIRAQHASLDAVTLVRVKEQQ